MMISPSECVEPIAQERRERRRRQCQINQQKYRDRKKKQKQAVEAQVLELREKIQQQQLVNESLRQSLIGKEAQHMVWNARIVESYGDLFRYGYVEDSNELQVQCIDHNFIPAFVLQSEVHQIGRRYLLQQWQRYTMVFPQILAERAKVEAISCAGNIVRITFNIRAPITRACLIAMFPSVLQDEELTQRVLGQALKYHLIQTAYFDDAGRITYMSTDCDFITAWNSLLDDSTETARIMANCRLNETLIDLGEDELDKILEEEMKHLSLENKKRQTDHLLPAQEILPAKVKDVCPEETPMDVEYCVS